MKNNDQENTIENILKAGDFSNLPWILHSPRGGLHVSPQKLAIYLRENYEIKNTTNGLMIYENGNYNFQSNSSWVSFIKEFLPPEIRTKRNWGDVLSELKTDEPIPFEKFNSYEDIINFKNGIFILSENKLVSHNPQYLTTVQIPANYISGCTLKDAPTVNRFLDDLTNGDESLKKTLLQFAGGVFSNVKGSRFKKLLILFGAGNTGKTVYRELLNEIVGAQNRATINLSDLNSTFGPEKLENKRLAGNGEMTFSRFSEVNILKELTGGDEINVNIKHGRARSMKYKGFLCFVCNNLPAFGGDQGEHVFERFIIIPCNNVILPEKRDAHLLEKMLKEKDVFVSLAIQSLRLAVLRDYQFTEGEEILKARKEYSITNNSLYLFVNLYCQIGKGRTLRSEFNRRYKDFCLKNYYHQEKPHEIKNLISNKFGIEAVKYNEFYYDFLMTMDDLEE